MALLSFLPDKILFGLDGVSLESFSELRLRAGYAVFALSKDKKFYIGKDGLTLDGKKAIICTREDLREIIENITEKSLYAFNDRLKQGFLTTKDGVRVGISGECVFDNGKTVTVKNFTSLNIRIPHEIKGCSAKIYSTIFDKGIFNTLIVSPPAKGKTTILKDLARRLNERRNKSILIIDERGEFSSVTGENIDSIKYSDKDYAFNIGIRSMSPQIVITDEMQTEKDWKCVERAVTDGVKIIASCHGNCIDDIKNKPYFNRNVFERYVVLDGEKNAGTVKGMFDMDFNGL